MLVKSSHTKRLLVSCCYGNLIIVDMSSARCQQKQYISIYVYLPWGTRDRGLHSLFHFRRVFRNSRFPPPPPHIHCKHPCHLMPEPTRHCHRTGFLSKAARSLSLIRLLSTIKTELRFISGDHLLQACVLLFEIMQSVYWMSTHICRLPEINLQAVYFLLSRRTFGMWIIIL